MRTNTESCTVEPKLRQYRFKKQMVPNAGNICPGGLIKISPSENFLDRIFNKNKHQSNLSTTLIASCSSEGNLVLFTILVSI